MRLYSLTGASALDDPEFGHFDAEEDGGFELPDDLAERLHKFHFAGRQSWEDQIERQARLMSEEMERRKDPATLLEAVELLVAASRGVTPVHAAADPEDKPPAKRPAKRAPARTDKPTE